MARGATPEIRRNLLNRSQERDDRCIDDESEGCVVSEMRQGFLNCSEVRDDECVDDEGVGGAVSEMVRGP